MGKFLIRKFIKNYEDVKDPKVRQTYGKFAGIVGIVSNLLLCVMKIIIGLVSSSIAIIADGVNNLTDASSSIITLVGFKMASQPEDKDHPYGHARIEYLTGLFISILIIIVGLFLLRSSVYKIIDPQMLSFDYITIIVLLLAIAIKLWQTFFNMYVGKKIDSRKFRRQPPREQVDRQRKTVHLGEERQDEGRVSAQGSPVPACAGTRDAEGEGDEEQRVDDDQ